MSPFGIVVPSVHPALQLLLLQMRPPASTSHFPEAYSIREAARPEGRFSGSDENDTPSLLTNALPSGSPKTTTSFPSPAAMSCSSREVGDGPSCRHSSKGCEARDPWWQNTRRAKANRMVFMSSQFCFEPFSMTTHPPDEVKLGIVTKSSALNVATPHRRIGGCVEQSLRSFKRRTPQAGSRSCLRPNPAPSSIPASSIAATTSNNSASSRTSAWISDGGGPLFQTDRTGDRAANGARDSGRTDRPQAGVRPLHSSKRAAPGWNGCGPVIESD